MHAVVLTRSPFPTDPVFLSPWAVATLFGVQRVDRMYASALVRLRTSAQLHVFVAQYVRFYRPNKQLELLHLNAAEVWEPSHALDVHSLDVEAMRARECIPTDTVYLCVCVHVCVYASEQGKGPSIDTAFSMFQRRRQIKQEMSQSVNVSVLDRIKLEKSKAESIKEALSARTKQVRP